MLHADTSERHAILICTLSLMHCSVEPVSRLGRWRRRIDNVVKKIIGGVAGEDPGQKEYEAAMSAFATRAQAAQDAKRAALETEQVRLIPVHQTACCPRC